MATSACICMQTEDMMYRAIKVSTDGMLGETGTKLTKYYVSKDSVTKLLENGDILKLGVFPNSTFHGNITDYYEALEFENDCNVCFLASETISYSKNLGFPCNTHMFSSLNECFSLANLVYLYDVNSGVWSFYTRPNSEPYILNNALLFTEYYDSVENLRYSSEDALPDRNDMYDETKNKIFDFEYASCLAPYQIALNFNVQDIFDPKNSISISDYLRIEGQQSRVLFLVIDKYHKPHIVSNRWLKRNRQSVGNIRELVKVKSATK